MACRTCKHPARKHHSGRGGCLLPRCICHRYVESRTASWDLCKFCLRESDDVMDEQCFSCWKKRGGPQEQFTHQELQRLIADLNSKEIKP